MFFLRLLDSRLFVSQVLDGLRGMLEAFDNSVRLLAPVVPSTGAKTWHKS
jgi:hypothetical protein